jgi:hypothetical protein
MLDPPPQGDPYELLPAGQTNPDAWGCVIAWDAYKTLAGVALPGFINDMQILQGVPM